MSDQCSMQIVCRREDAPLFEELGFNLEGGLRLRRGILWSDVPADMSSVVLLSQDEVNQAAWVGDGEGGFGDLPRGVPYYGSNSAGSNYGAGVFATLGKTLEYARCLNNSTSPAVELDSTTGRLDRVGLRVAKKYVATLGLVRWVLVTHLRQHSPELCGRRKQARTQPAKEDSP